jgi:hypothetical protein
LVFTDKKYFVKSRLCYVAYNSRLFNSSNSCSLWSIIVVVALGKCAHRTPAGVRERHISYWPHLK